MGHFYLFKKKGTDVTNLNLIEKWKFGGIYLFYSVLFYNIWFIFSHFNLGICFPRKQVGPGEKE